MQSYIPPNPKIVNHFSRNSSKKMNPSYPKTLLLPVIILLTMLVHGYFVDSRHLAGYPAVAPVAGDDGTNADMVSGYGKRKRIEHRGGSLPATCHSKCNQCNPCMPVEVSIREMARVGETDEYYPIVWKCMCQHDIFPP